MYIATHMSENKSLVERARESARSARARARAQYQMGGGNHPMDELEIQRVIEHAIAKARSEARSEAPTAIIHHQVKQAIESARKYDLEQEGGKKNMVSPQKVINRKVILQRVVGSGKMPSDRAIRNSLRSYSVMVNGKSLEKLASEHGSKVGKKHYYHGEPGAAARKVVAFLGKTLWMDLPSLQRSVEIQMTEVTKGVHKAKKKPVERYTNQYYGWREPIDPVDTGRVNKKGEPIMAEFINHAIPTHGVSRERAYQIHLKRSKIARQRPTGHGGLSTGPKPKVSNLLKKSKILKTSH